MRVAIIVVTLAWVLTEAPFDSQGVLAGAPYTRGLPLVEMPLPREAAPADAIVANCGPAPAMAFFLSGDGGWTTIDRVISRELVASGVPVVGLNSLQYFWRDRDPQEVADAVGAQLEHYLAQWRRSEVILIGYSRGADALPYVLTRLSPEVRAKVRLAVVIGSSRRLDFEIRLTDFIADVLHTTSGARDTVAEARRVPGVPLLCLYGSREKHSLCPALAGAPRVAVREFGGGHHLGGDYRRIASIILAQEQSLSRAPAARPTALP